MSRDEHWLGRQMAWGVALVGVSLLVFVVGLLLQVLGADQPFDPRLVSGLGVLLLGVGIGRLVQYMTLRRDPGAVRRIRIEAQDERTTLMRMRAGSRAHLVSELLTFALLMWVSFASHGQLSALSKDELWFALAAVVVVPMLVFVGSMVYEARRG